MGGARLITHLFNAMPQLHHRDPSIIGMLGASPHLSSRSSAVSPPTSPVGPTFQISRQASNGSLAKRALAAHGEGGAKATSEAFDELVTPPQTPVLAPIDSDLLLKKGETAKLDFERPFYEMIVDGIHSHPNSVRVSTRRPKLCAQHSCERPSSHTLPTLTVAF
jgi:N-acetylglucosamine-6-phosphate deacetylase